MLLITITLCVTLYNIVYFYAPVRPQQSTFYYWPGAFGNSVGGSNNTLEEK
jgi:hypothetical protein